MFRCLMFRHPTFRHQGVPGVGCSAIVMGGILPLSRVLVVCLGTLVVPLDSMVNLDFPSIIQRFGLGIPEIQWLVISYTLTHASLLLVFGRIGDMIGHRRIFLVGTAWSAVAFALCGAAPTYAWLLFARCLQGVGAGLVLSCGAALVTGFVAEERRARVLGLYTMMFGLGSALGPLLAGVMVSRWGWSAVFWARAPIAMASCALGFVLPAPALARPAQRERFDAIGAALLVLTISTLLLTLNRLRTPQVAVAFAVVTLAALWGFVRQERRVAQPIIDLRLFRIAGFAAVNLGHALMNLAGFAIMLLMPFYLDRVAGLPALSLGLVLAIGSLGMVLAAPIAGGSAPAAAADVGRCAVRHDRAGDDRRARGTGRSCSAGGRDVRAGLRAGAVPGRLFRRRYRNDPAAGPRCGGQPGHADAHRWRGAWRNGVDAGVPDAARHGGRSGRVRCAGVPVRLSRRVRAGGGADGSCAGDAGRARAAVAPDQAPLRRWSGEG
jgi:MFS family permease